MTTATSARATLTAPELLEEFTRTGHQAPYEEVVRRYGGMVYHTCYKVTKNQHDAEDAAQAAFLSLAVQCRAGKTIKAVGPWLQRVGHRLALDIRRSHKRRENRENRHIEMQRHTHPSNGRGFHLEEHSQPTGHGPDQGEIQRMMHDALQTLPPRYRMPMILHYFGGLSREQIAKELHCKVSTLGVRIHRGREMLRKKLSSRGLVMSIDSLTTLLGACVGLQVNESMIASTSIAAQSVAMGSAVDPAHLSAVVLRLAHRAAHAVAMARLKVAVASILLATPMLFAARPVIDRISEINWQNLAPIQLLQDFLIQLKDSFTPTVLAENTPATEIKVEAPLATPKTETVTVQIDSNYRPILSKQKLSTPTHVPAPTAWSNYSLSKGPAAPSLPPLRIDAEPTVSMAMSPALTPLSITNAPAAEKSSGESSDDPVIMASTSGDGSGDMPAMHAGSAVPVASSAVRSKSVAQSLLGDSPAILGSLANPRTGEGFTVARSASAEDGSTSTLVYSSSTSANQFRGWGTATNATNVVQSGEIIADGFGANRTLDLSHVTIDASQDNSPYGGTDGWYATHTGRLILPSLRVYKGDSTITWGESSADPTLDLVNSARLTFHDVTAESDVSIALLSLDSSLHPVFPKHHHFIGVWSIDGLPEHDGMTDLMIRYDSELAFQLGLPETVLKLWVYNPDEGWHRIMDETFGRSIQENLIWGSYNGTFTFFAVSAPEPTGLLLLAGSSFLLMRRTRRARKD